MITFVLLLVMGILGFLLGRYSIKKSIKSFNDAYNRPIVFGKSYDEFKDELPSYIGNLLDIAHSYGYNDKYIYYLKQENQNKGTF